jgi:DNA replication protein DnaC
MDSFRNFQAPEDIVRFLAEAEPALEKETCPICHDRGWELFINKDGYEMARICSCQLERMRPHLLKRAYIPTTFQRCSFSNFKEYIPNKSIKTALAKALEFYKSYPAVSRGLLISGPSGCGKTHLAVSILSDLVTEKGVRGCYINYRDLLESLRENMDSYEEANNPTFEAENSEVLLLDDLGGARTTEWARDVLANLLHSRQKNTRRFLIATTVFPDTASAGQTKLEDRISPALRSLLYELCETITISAPDYRQEVISRKR